MSAHLVWALAALPLLTLLHTLLNRLTWRRGAPSPGPRPTTAVLVPARDEAENIVACVRSALDAGADEVLVYDDGSTDETPALLAAMQASEPRLEVLQGLSLPAGWLGKPHACARLAEASTAERLVFLDADVRLARGALERLDGLFCTLDADVVTAVPRQVMVSPAERLLMPMLHLTYVSWLWLELVHRSKDPRFLAANGQLLAVRRSAYEAFGGFFSVRGEVVDDMALCRAAKRAGCKVAFIDGHELARCRMYRGAAQIWAGFTKNLYPGIGGTPVALLVVLALYLGAFVLAWVALPLALLGLLPGLLAPAAAGVLFNLVARAVLTWRHDHPRWSPLTTPVAALGFCGIAVGSWWKARRGALTWRGRSVPAAKEACS